VRWFRNTLKGSALEFGCEILCDNPEAAAAASEDAKDGEKRAPVIVFPLSPRNESEGALPQIVTATGTFGVDQGMALTRGKETGFAVLTKLVEQGPGSRSTTTRPSADRPLETVTYDAACPRENNTQPISFTSIAGRLRAFSLWRARGDPSARGR
jgi:hypothetical protein